MKNIFKTVALGAITMFMVSCASQKDKKDTDNQRPVNQQGTVGQQQGRQQQGGPPSFAQLLSELDANKDGKLEKSEMKGPLENEFTKLDTDEDGYLSESEFKKAAPPQGGGQRSEPRNG